MAVQEVKAHAEDLSGHLDAVAGMQGYFHFAQKKGYSGVGLYTKKTPSDVIAGFGSKEFDAEGRWVEARFDTAKRKISIISCYFPSGSSSEERQAAKFRFLARMYPHLMKLKAGREFVLVGDVNIAHHEIDLKNWKGNFKNSGFTPEERAWMTKLLTTGGLVDVFRTLNTQPEQYTWWSSRGQAWAKNVGWRIASSCSLGLRRHRAVGPQIGVTASRWGNSACALAFHAVMAVAISSRSKMALCSSVMCASDSAVGWSTA